MTAGRLILMGSGETSGRLVAAHRLGVERAGAREALVLDTPYGFQENAPLISRRLTGFFRTSLSIRAAVGSYRSTDHGPLARERMLSAVRRARYVFAGPGSPSYAVGVWKGTGLASALGDLLSTGATITMASAAALTVGARTLPVYEIYKVGAGLGWLPGLNLTGRLGPQMAVIPHWNNTEGQNFDTSRCYMGRRRFERLRSMLPRRTGVLGLDEHTAAVIDFGREELSVLGAGGVTLCGDRETVLGAGENMRLGTVFSLLHSQRPPPPVRPGQPRTDLADAVASRSPESIATALLTLESQAADGSEAARNSLRAGLVELSGPAAAGLASPAEVVGGYVDLLVEARAGLRSRKRWRDADRIRCGLQALGVTLRDTRSGTVWALGNNGSRTTR